ncbi:7-deoxyloganetic acid glucosyltransferase-like [Pyrus ussuriensis x Pyrus communis]|uniref:7-deoxyloganetic acid glucosyltransferase-like n=1 Tax=Pyrus ussuriensis x Pyrus communis TaxID=2448454 RepID=A0A5N5H7D6_9ROSA|nr:7-deoxyloganetic acid glucosyltransferase-like [Pyrus ussuriensis x Pyrus communis]
MCFAIDVAEKVGVPAMAITVISGCGYWSYSCIPNLIQQGHVPFTDEDMDKQSSDIPGMEGLLRRRDLPGFCRFSIDHPVTKIFMEVIKATRASALIINTFDGLEASILSHIATLFPQVYAIGPVHALVKSRVGDGLSSSASLRQEDRRCMAWLDSKQVGSVIYVSFGSLVELTHDQLFEFWHGLVSCGKQFLWVVRSDMISGEQGEHVIPTELKMGTKERGLIVEWAPQEEVLAHKAVGGFLTQCGWNSILEGIWAGVPMLCWPRLAEQLVTSRWIGEVWRIGIDMKDTCERSMVEKMIRRLMEEGDEREQILRSVERFSKLARGAVTEGGSSYNNLDKLIQDLRNF